jgi:hypothetical protein
MTFGSGRGSSSGFISLDDDQTFFDFFLAEELNFRFRAGRSQNASKSRAWQQKRQQHKREGRPVASLGL